MIKYNKWFMAMPEYADDVAIMDQPKEVWLRDGVTPVRANADYRCFSIFKIVETKEFSSLELRALFDEGIDEQKKKSFSEHLEEARQEINLLED